MRYCASDGCSGLDPCDGCSRIRRAVLMKAVQEAGLSKEQAEKFFRSYADTFAGALGEVKKLAEEAGQKRLEEKAARDKQAAALEKKEGRKAETSGGGAKVTPLKDKLARNAAYGKPENGQVKEEATGNNVATSENKKQEAAPTKE